MISATLQVHSIDIPRSLLAASDAAWHQDTNGWERKQHKFQNMFKPRVKKRQGTGNTFEICWKKGDLLKGGQVSGFLYIYIYNAWDPGKQAILASRSIYNSHQVISFPSKTACIYNIYNVYIYRPHHIPSLGPKPTSVASHMAIATLATSLQEGRDVLQTICRDQPWRHQLNSPLIFCSRKGLLWDFQVTQL